MIDDSKTDELNPAESVEDEFQLEDFQPVQPRARRKRKGRNGADDRPDEELGLADGAVSSGRGSLHEQVDAIDDDKSKPEGQIPDRQSDDAQASAETGSSDKPGSPERERKVDSSVAICEANKRRFRERKMGHSHPIGQLEHTELQLKKRATAQQILSGPKPKGQGNDLLIYQIDRALNTGSSCNTIRERIRRENFALYRSLEASDPIESILNRHIITISHAAIECQYETTFGSTQLFDVYARNTAKLTKVLIELIEARERRRRPKRVVVRDVNIEAGGQAIVGTVEARKQGSRSDDDASEDSTEE